MKPTSEGLHPELKPSELIKSAPLLTYFEDIYGCIYATFGRNNNPRRDLIKSTLVYLPVSKEIATKRQIYGDKERYFIRHVDDNCAVKPKDETNVPKEMLPIIHSRYTTDPKTHEPILAVPSNEVVRVYNPHDAFITLANGKLDFLPKNLTETLQLVIRDFEEYGIPVEAIGLYGGLQTMMLPILPQTQIHDIDILVTGLEYLPRIKKLTYAKKGNRRTNRDSEILPYQKAIARWEDIATYQIDGTDIEIKTSRSVFDRNSYPYFWDSTGTILQGTGRIIDDSEGLTLPASFKIQTDRGNILNISTAMFLYMGAGWNGDRVSFVGEVGKDGTILLVNPDRDFIYCTE